MTEEKTPFQKLLTDWVFNQSVGVVISLCFVVYSQYQNNVLVKRIENLDAQVKDMLIYERDKLSKTLDENTRALHDFKNFNLGRKAR